MELVVQTNVIHNQTHAFAKLVLLEQMTVQNVLMVIMVIQIVNLVICVTTMGQYLSMNYLNVNNWMEFKNVIAKKIILATYAICAKKAGTVEVNVVFMCKLIINV